MKYSLTIAAVLLLWSLPTAAQFQVPSKGDASPELNGKSVTVVKLEKAPVPTDPLQALRTARSIHVKSTSLLVGVSVIEDKLQKRPEFRQLNLVITRDFYAADLILEVEHDVFTMYTYTVVEPQSKIVVATGKLSSLGGTVAAKVAERFLKQMLRARQS